MTYLTAMPLDDNLIRPARQPAVPDFLEDARRVNGSLLTYTAGVRGWGLHGNAYVGTWFRLYWRRTRAPRRPAYREPRCLPARLRRNRPRAWRRRPVRSCRSSRRGTDPPDEDPGELARAGRRRER
jgi:hypothetical protein